MELFNPATSQTTNQPDGSAHVWISAAGWVPVQPVEEVEEDESGAVLEAEAETAVAVQDTAEVTAEDTAQGHHLAAKATKDQ